MKQLKKRVDVYQVVTDQIVQALSEGVIPWRKTWQGGGSACNYVTKHTYRGINAILTNLSPYPRPYFVTLKQANGLGGSVKKGSSSLPIVYWKVIHKDADGKTVSEEEGVGKQFFLKYYRVFNIADIEGVEFDLPEVSHNHDRFDQCEQLIDQIPNPPMITFGGGQPYYAPPIDTVMMPELNQFESPSEYYATFFHELVHSTGHTSRLMREEVMGTVKFGSLVYSQEELTAEIGSAFLCRIVGIDNPETFTNSAAYIQGWLQKLEDDKRFIFRAASQAKQAVEYLVG